MGVQGLEVQGLGFRVCEGFHMVVYEEFMTVYLGFSTGFQGLAVCRVSGFQVWFSGSRTVRPSTPELLFCGCLRRRRSGCIP